MDASQQNQILIDVSRDLHLKIALGCCIKFKTHYTIDSQKYNRKRLQWNNKLKPMIKIYTIILSFFRSPQYEPEYNQNFDSTKYFAVYAAKTYCIILVLFIHILDHILETHGNNLKENIIGMIYASNNFMIYASNDSMIYASNNFIICIDTSII
eukprot:37644_1